MGRVRECFEVDDRKRERLGVQRQFTSLGCARSASTYEMNINAGGKMRMFGASLDIVIDEIIQLACVAEVRMRFDGFLNASVSRAKRIRGVSNAHCKCNIGEIFRVYIIDVNIIHAYNSVILILNIHETRQTIRSAL